jgi:hypothetical protein
MYVYNNYSVDGIYLNLWMKSSQMVRAAITACAQVATLLGSIPMIWVSNDVNVNVYWIRVEYRISDIQSDIGYTACVLLEFPLSAR